jgi:hypothetical protein
MHVPLRYVLLAEVHMSLLLEQPFTAYVGIDWADTKHDICVQAAGDPRESSCIAHRVAAIDERANALHRRFGGPMNWPRGQSSLRCRSMISLCCFRSIRQPSLKPPVRFGTFAMRAAAQDAGEAHLKALAEDR